jgi:tRNA pseudouridine55 synthase
MTSGFLLLDKNVGSSSFQALYPVKRLFRGLKVGHAGTLDPAASGLLLVAIGHATRLLEFIEGMPKVYRFDLQLGLTTDTYDLDGEVLSRHEVPVIDDTALEAVLQHFRGPQKQTPPAYSAIKIQGKRACDRVRAGETVEIAARDVTIHNLKVIGRNENTITLELFCSKGTYVRTLAHDIGQRLGCGGIATHIRRLRIGPFDISEAKTEDKLTGEADLLPLASAMKHLPGVHLIDRWVGPLLNGNSIPAVGYAVIAPEAETAAPKAESRGENHTSETLFRVHDKSGQLLAIAEINALRQLMPRKVLNPA